MNPKNRWIKASGFYCSICGYHTNISHHLFDNDIENYADRQKCGTDKYQKAYAEQQGRWILEIEKAEACPFCKDNNRYDGCQHLDLYYGWNDYATEKQLRIIKRHYENISAFNRPTYKALANILIDKLGDLAMLPRYDKTARRKSFEALPKGAYVVKILNAEQEKSKNGIGSHIKVSFDIAEGEYANFYTQQYKANTNENKDWPYDAVFYVNIPDDRSPEWMRLNYNTFFADLEDSNDGFVCTDVKTMKNKLIGGKFRIEQKVASNGNVYDHTKLYWTCVADDVRNGKAGKLPNDKLVSNPQPVQNDGFMDIPENVDDDGLPFN